MFTILRNRKQARTGSVLILGLLFIGLLGACGPAAEATPTPMPAPPTATATASPAPPAEEPTPSAIPQTRDEIIAYTVQPGDTLGSIAAQFGLQPETVLWANYALLGDRPDWLTLDMELSILPVDGIYHQVGGGETLTSIASFFAVEVEDIIEWPGNELSGPNPVILNGQWLLVPGGQRLSRARQMPDVPREAAELDIAEYGSGACPQDYASDWAGDGDYAWPLASHSLLAGGFDAEWHPGVDLAAQLDDQVLAADDGVVVFSGWSNLGYGYLVMLDHGNGDYSLYAGLGQVSAACGHEVAEGELLGLAGISNHPAGAFVDFEVRRGGQALDPLTLLPTD